MELGDCLRVTCEFGLTPSADGGSVRKMKRHMNRLGVGALLVISMAGPAFAVDYLQETTKLLLKRNPSGKQKLMWVTRMPSPPLPSENPGDVGATVEVRNPITGLSNGFTMPLGSDWSANGANTVYKFRNPSAPMGDSEIKVAVIKGGTLVKIIGRSVGSELNDPPHRALAVILSIGAGSDRYCGGCASPTRDQQDVFAAKHCPAPAACGSSPSGAFLD